ncbi:hypothetical protein DFQ28_003318 [Apophysomyces sp. BC1034]|nr:hypothetical protein DFQ30_004922 [Apophysomyces sp. BC1015]KAG0180490.1 hypothetical protein DFQ29_000579 [Apophysomyces sp. BC1021]KAG0189504.1 hypothetical protein DFQ28_003318 [Apophysomyces sp. BC1034]
MRITVSLLIALPCVVIAESNAYCQGIFASTKENCEKFDFGSLRDSDRCTNSTDTSNTTFHGTPLANCTTFYDITNLPNQPIDAHTTKMALLITNVFENSNTEMGYAAVQKLGDCRGYTCGYIGFTTGTNDAWSVVKQYTKRKADNDLQKYLPELARLSAFEFGDPRRDDTANLVGYPEAWKDAACKDPVFVRTQLDVGNAMYLKPAMKYAASVDVHSNLGKFIFYDTIIQHGWQYVEPQINLPRILELTGPRKHDESEKSYLTRFITIRRQLACCFPGDVWNESSDRESDLQDLVNDWDRNKDLEHSVHLTIFNVTVTGTEDMTYDMQHCKKEFNELPAPIDLPIPDTCPNPL